MSIKSFIYLDTYKMYSISSQIFEGLTDYILNTQSNVVEEKTEQKGPFSSGKLMADAITKNENQTEKKFLHDYSYLLFEQELKRRNKVLEVDANNLSDCISKFGDFSFIKITGKAIFNDTQILHNLIKNFNDFGYSIGYVTMFNEHQREINEKISKSKLITDKNQKTKLLNEINLRRNHLKQSLQDKGLQFEDEFLEQLANLIEFAYKREFEIQIPLIQSGEKILFSTIIEREMLRVKESTLIRRYATETEKEFTIFGILSQTNFKKNNYDLTKKVMELLSSNVGSVSSQMRSAIMNFIIAISELENGFNGKLNYEICIEPIAIYREL